jgi:hypothetical protein
MAPPMIDSRNLYINNEIETLNDVRDALGDAPWSFELPEIRGRLFSENNTSSHRASDGRGDFLWPTSSVEYGRTFWKRGETRLLRAANFVLAESPSQLGCKRQRNRGTRRKARKKGRYSLCPEWSASCRGKLILVIGRRSHEIIWPLQRSVSSGFRACGGKAIMYIVRADNRTVLGVFARGRGCER